MNGLPIRTMWDVWSNAVAKFPRKTAVIWQLRSYSYAELDRAVTNLSTRLARDLRLAKGDRLAIAAPNCIEFYLTYWAAMRLGLVLVPLNIRLRPDMIAFILKYQDRIVYGTDLEFLKNQTSERAIKEWEDQYARDWRYFSTRDTFEYDGHKTQGLGLPPDVLRKLYHANAVHWFPGIVKP